MTFDTTPKPYFLQAMRNQSWKPSGALAELVDNSFGPGRGNADLCQIIYHPTKRTLTVVDNGAGMASLGRLFQLGNTIGRTPGDIGLYGSGGTMALLWLADGVSVFTLRDGMVAHDSVWWSGYIKADKYPQIDESWHKVALANCPPELIAHGHGTLINITLDRKLGRLNTSNIRRDLAKLYGPGIRAGKQIIWTTLGRSGETETLTDPIPIPDEDDKVVDFYFHLDVNDELLPVTGRVALVDGLKFNDSGVHIGYGSRVIITTKDCFVSPDGTRYNGTSVIGWLDLGEGWQPYLSTDKSGINDRPLWVILMTHVFERIKPLLEESDDEKLSLELEDIALSLQNLFDGQATVTVPRKPIEIPAIDQPDGDKDPIKERKTTESENDEEGDQPQDKPARASIEITAIDDAALDGVLCRADQAAGNISVFVNKEHSVIEMALVQKPVNRMCLNMIVVAEIANVMASDSALCQIAFKPRVAAELIELDDPAARARRLIRLMSDQIKVKQAS